MALERQMIGMSEPKKQELRNVLENEEIKIQKESRKKMCPADFESLVIVGRGAFGEVRLVRRKGKKEDPATGQIFALKSMKKEMMVVKNQVHHVKAERDALATADSSNQWLTALHYSFFDDTHLYMAMEFMPGGDLMSLLIKEDTFDEQCTRFFMAEAAQAISSVHALGYIHRDIKPDSTCVVICFVMLARFSFGKLFLMLTSSFITLNSFFLLCRHAAGLPRTLEID